MRSLIFCGILSIYIFPLTANEPKNDQSLVGQEAPNWALKTSTGSFEFLNNYTAPKGETLRQYDVKEKF